MKATIVGKDVFTPGVYFGPEVRLIRDLRTFHVWRINGHSIWNNATGQKYLPSRYILAEVLKEEKGYNNYTIEIIPIAVEAGQNWKLAVVALSDCVDKINRNMITRKESFDYVRMKLEGKCNVFEQEADHG